MSTFYIKITDSEQDIKAAFKKEVIGKGVHRIQQIFSAKKHDVFFYFMADSTMSINLKIWQDKKPPFRHISLIIIVRFEDGLAVEIIQVTKKRFGISDGIISRST